MIDYLDTFKVESLLKTNHAEWFTSITNQAEYELIKILSVILG